MTGTRYRRVEGRLGFHRIGAPMAHGRPAVFITHGCGPALPGTPGMRRMSDSRYWRRTQSKLRLQQKFTRGRCSPAGSAARGGTQRGILRPCAKKLSDYDALGVVSIHLRRAVKVRQGRPRRTWRQAGESVKKGRPFRLRRPGIGEISLERLARRARIHSAGDPAGWLTG